eukprot:gnl/TRDRNA2_/TRDRNA2_196695_c0_seq1.p1 gnl/TRDRNA2_/TRDRNA2_196695_c0~~gnl/TRDRNA2_/TRDRNA2_196695_c0_seq1.p1  ORF type:complete len:190 (-),score=35.78 gnl/TRDRNA2_/TRDRNA2_196695_c0_seq1:139-708(-)
MAPKKLDDKDKQKEAHVGVVDKGSVQNCLVCLRGGLLRCSKLSEEHSGTSILSNRIIALYFSASWCPPCKEFTPILREAYEAILGAHGPKSFEVIVVPLDAVEGDWRTHVDEMPWLTMPWANREAIIRLFMHFQISKAPRLVIIDSRGEVVEENGRGNDGFGFGCDPLQAYTNFLHQARKVAKGSKASD